MTPVAILEPVKLSGTFVKRATLHNFDEISSKDIRIGDFVEVEKAGEIIPQIIGVNRSKRTENSEIFLMPELCPVCSELLVKLEDEVVSRCINSSCPAQLERQIVHFSSKGAMNIEGMGPQMVSALLSNHIIESIADLYVIKEDQLVVMERMGKRSSQNLIDSIEKSKSNSLENLIYGLGIRHIGKETSISLADSFKNIDRLMSAGQESLTEIHDVGVVMAKSIMLYFSNKKNIELIEKLKYAGVNMLFTNRNSEINQFFSGKVFVITGSFLKYGREEIKDIITKNNGRVSSAVSKATDFLICGTNPGSKLNKAIEIGKRIIHEDELQILLNKE